jgi:hypothetical protein
MVDPLHGNNKNAVHAHRGPADAGMQMKLRKSGDEVRIFPHSINPLPDDQRGRSTISSPSHILSHAPLKSIRTLDLFSRAVQNTKTRFLLPYYLTLVKFDDEKTPSPPLHKFFSRPQKRERTAKRSRA